MQTKLDKPIVCIVGPTASGKSEVAQLLAVSLGGEVLSADSMQIYKGMDIGTGKVVCADQLVAHHGLDLVDPGEAFSAALYQTYARRVFADINNRGKWCILCGGTGFYVRAAIDDYQFPKGEQVDNPTRTKYLAYAEEHGAQALWEQLNQVDPDSASIIAPNDVKRVVRAFELLDDHTTYATQKEALAHIPELYPSVFIGLAVDPDILRARIDARVDAMFANGLVNEVEGLLNQGFRSAITANQAIGYKEVVAALEGKISMEEAREQIKISTHRYAKRQRTWFKKDARITWLNADEFDAAELARQAQAIVDGHKAR